MKPPARMRTVILAALLALACVALVPFKGFVSVKADLLIAAALGLGAVYLFVYRGIGRYIVAALYLAAAIQGFGFLRHPGRGIFPFLFAVGLAWAGSLLHVSGAGHWDRWLGGFKDLLAVVKPCRFSLITATVVVGVLALLPQGQDLLEHLAEWGDQAPYQPPWVEITLAFVGLVLLALASWYTARVAVDIHFGNPRGGDAGAPEFLKIWVPRWIGAIPFLGLAIANLLVLRFVPGDRWRTTALHLLSAAALCLLLGALFLRFLIARRRMLDRWNAEKGGRAPGSSPDRASAPLRAHLRENPDTRLALIFIVAAALVVFIALAWAPFSIWVAPMLGSIAVVFFAAAMWLPFGSFLAYLGHRHRFPLLTVLLLLVPLFSLINDNHRVRELAPAPRQASIVDELKRWLDLLDQKEPLEKKHPLVIVATEGGGIRAAYWTGSVLGKIQDRDPSFARHVFAISSVSGGSLGAGVFASLVDDASKGRAGSGDCKSRVKNNPGEWTCRAQNILGDNLLSADLAALLSGDFIQRFLPFPIPAWDRSRALEGSWERAYAKVIHQDTLAQPFTDLSACSTDWVPRLVLNSTWVENGKRAITTPFLEKFAAGEAAEPCSAAGQSAAPLPHPGTPSTLFVDSLPVLDGRRHDFRISSALHNSARFPYVSPAGVLEVVSPPGSGHIVDGGLFENSGAASALELISHLRKIIAQDKQFQGRISPILIVGIVSNPEETTVPTSAGFLVDALAPPKALWNSRDARASLAVASLRGVASEMAEEDCQGKAAPPTDQSSKPPICDQGKIFQFKLVTEDGKKKLLIPLGWQLSELAKKSMDDQLNRPDVESSVTRLVAATGPSKR
jgi:hypothetical protein